jgi:hypothetical protein
MYRLSIFAASSQHRPLESLRRGPPALTDCCPDEREDLSQPLLSGLERRGEEGRRNALAPQFKINGAERADVTNAVAMGQRFEHLNPTIRLSGGCSATFQTPRDGNFPM